MSELGTIGFGLFIIVAAVGGAAGPIDALARRRRLGPSWSSRLLQELLVVMLDDPDTNESAPQLLAVWRF